MTAPDPRPGDRVLIKATVADDQPGGDNVLVSIFGRTDQVDLNLHPNQVVQVLGPWWWPPQVGDHVLDAAGIVWQCRQKDAGGLYWLAIDGSTVNGDELPRLCGPLELIVRDRKAVDR